MKNKVNHAFMFALEAHQGQFRKDGKPYISHPFSVAMILAQNGACEDLICAGLLHDVIEDTEIKGDRIEKEFGSEVLRLIMFDTEDKDKTWLERKKQTLEDLDNCDRDCAMLICADKLANIRDLEEIIDEFQENAWKYFKFGREYQEWLYRQYLDKLSRLSNLNMYKELKQKVDIIFTNKGE